MHIALIKIPLFSSYNTQYLIVKYLPMVLTGLWLSSASTFILPSSPPVTRFTVPPPPPPLLHTPSAVQGAGCLGAGGQRLNSCKFSQAWTMLTSWERERETTCIKINTTTQLEIIRPWGSNCYSHILLWKQITRLSEIQNSYIEQHLNKYWTWNFAKAEVNNVGLAIFHNFFYVRNVKSPFRSLLSHATLWSHTLKDHCWVF